jgi:branched-chain amino acid transport system substrate-binding protein
MKHGALLGILASHLIAGLALADVNVGVTLSATGPAASLGIPEKNTFEMLPRTIAGEKVNWIVLDDASDTTKAVTNTRKLIAEEKVDVIVGSTITPNSLAMIDVAADAETPMISMAASARIVDPTNPKTKWVFKTPQSDSLMADAIAINMKANGVKTMGYIGFADGYGDGWLAEMRRSAQTAGIKIVGEEKYNRTDTSVTGQVLKLVAANPDAILIVAAGSPPAITRARSTRRTGSPIPTSCASSARTATARYCRSARCSFSSSCRTRTLSKSPPRSTSTSTKRSTARTRAPPSAVTRGMRICCFRRRSPRR